MVTVQLKPEQERQLQKLASASGQDASELAARILSDYLMFQTLSEDTEEQWAESSVALTSEILDREHWDHEESQDGSQ